ncbi:ubiquitin-conjugating enzyme E2 W isoform X2 [Castor canadensis]|uniref:Ubiquitin-conjugating enzyme E2 W isoform X2 n=1 Tax=Castor canadensis TaxID=51338 RepID=A0AC58M611_CASCN
MVPSWRQCRKEDRSMVSNCHQLIGNLDCFHFLKRLQKELLALQNDPPPGMTLNEKSVQNSITQWIVDMEGAPGTLYEGEKFQLLFKFSSRYPFDSPQVMFTGENIPVHPHVYSNGHICLSILTEDWSPALSVQSVCLSIISMLSSCKEKRRPPDNSFYVRTCNKNPKKTKWWYHGHLRQIVHETPNSKITGAKWTGGQIPERKKKCHNETPCTTNIFNDKKEVLQHSLRHSILECLKHLQSTHLLGLQRRMRQRTCLTTTHCLPGEDS